MRAARPVTAVNLPYKYVVAFVFVVGIFINLLDTTIVNVALPTLKEEFDVSTTGIQWVVTSYLLALAIFIPVSGWAGDRLGTKRVYVISLATFTGASLLCGLAWNIESMIGFRVLQGIGGGMIAPTGTAMLWRTFPPAERAAAAAILNIPIVIAPASGPIIGGYLVEYHDWPWIFLINVPVGIAGVLVAILFLREETQPHTARLDVPGFLLSAVGLGVLLYGLSTAGDHGLYHPQALTLVLTGLALIAAFCVVELRSTNPMIDIRLFRNRLFSAGNVVQFMSQVALQGSLFLMPLFLQFERGMSPLESGLTTFTQAIGVMAMLPIAGRLYKRVGPRRLTLAGMLLITFGTGALGFVGIETSRTWIMLIMLIRGCGFGLCLVALQAATFATISSRDTGRATAVYATGRQVAASVGVAILATVLASRLGAHGAELGDALTSAGATQAFQEAFFAASLVALVGLVATLLIDDREASISMTPRARRAPPPADAEPLATSIDA
ncbi:MAG: DHA2 family efflux MFS transporter permease subunit [Dehalococcoidia bacterium]|nr:DHA2 family efflux MFS transporter permease subunit [Dehalococcoidia bacterium]